MERLRNAIWHIGQGLTVTSVAEEAMENALETLEKRNGGKAFPSRTGQLAKSPSPRKNLRA